MADKQITALTALTTTPTSTDVLPIVDTSGSPTTKKIDWAHMLTGLWAGLKSSVFGAVSSQIFLSAGGAIPTTTAGCAPAAVIELGTNKINLKYLAFDASTEEHAQFVFSMPSDWDGGTITAKFKWLHPAATSYNVVWGIEGRSFANDEALDQAVGTAQVVTSYGGTTNDLYESAATAAVTLAGTPAAGELVVLQVFRKAADGSDTLNVDAYLLGVQITYTRT